MKKINILIAEDNKEARDLLAEGLEEFAAEFYQSEYELSLTKADSYGKALQRLNDSKKSGEYYDVFFCDIDFTEDQKGGRSDSGFELIEKAFVISPVTKIVTYSGQFRAKDLWPKFEELNAKGMILYTMDKSHNQGGDAEWLRENLKKIFDVYSSELFLKEIWQNHQKMISILSKTSLDKDPFENLGKQGAIVNNLDSILVLMRNGNRFEGSELIYRLIIYLYHHSLEIFCKADKDDQTILLLSDKNRPAAESLIGRLLGFQNSVTSVRVITAFSGGKIFRHGFRLNDMRNKSIHPGEKVTIDFTNVMTAHLTVAAYILEKNQIQYREIEENVLKNLGKDKGLNYFRELVSYLKN